MSYSLLLGSINKHVTLSKEEEDYFTSLLHPKKLRKKQFLLQEGEINRHTAFVLSGTLRAYSIDKNGLEHIVQFAPAGWWIADMQSFFNQAPATLNIDAIEPSEIGVMLKSDLDQLYSRFPKFERYFRILAENALSAYQQRLVNNLSLPATQRFENFCRLYPSLTQRLPQKYIASYIGVTPEFFSRMLGQLK